MKKGILTLGLTSLAMLITGCSNTAPHSFEEEEVKQNILLEDDVYHKDFVSANHGKKMLKDEEDSFIFPDTITLHYHRDDKDYGKKRFWMWSKSGAPEKEFVMSKDTTDWSRQFTFSPAELFESKSDDSFSFMVKNKDSWDGKSAEIPILYKEYPAKLQPDGTYKLDLYIIQVGTALKVFKTQEDALSDQIDTAFISKDYKKISIYTRDGTNNNKSIIKDLRIYKFNRYYVNLNDSLQLKLKNDYLIFTASNINKTNIAVKFNKTLSLNCKYVIECTFEDKPTVWSNYVVDYYNLYNTPEFRTLEYSGDDLGAHVSEDKKSTTFKVWAPTATSMGLKIYNRGYSSSFLPKETFNDSNERNACDEYTYYDMKLNLETAVWEITIPENLDGKYYTYKVKNTAGNNDVVDPYAKSAGIKGLRGMVIDFDNPKAKPEGWDDVPLVWDGKEDYDIKTPQELAVSEVHIRDLTTHETWGGPKEERGTFKGFIHEGTKYEGTPTGYDHLVDYGVNALQILPVFDFDNGERGVEEVAFNPKKPEEITKVTDYSALDDYNWGYNPLNYNCVEGAYSSDPRDGYTRVKEFRELIQKFATNKNHTRIIMDVVYNHVSSAPTSCFERLMPKYGFRFKDNGEYSDASGCGNEVKTEAPMMRKFIIDGLYHWATNYKIKGFRFDLMGAIDMETLSLAEDKLYRFDKDIVMYGEGWHAAEHPSINDGLIATNKNIHKHLSPDRTNSMYKDHLGFVGGFNNGIRDSLKGDNDIKKPTQFRGFIGGGANGDARYKIGLLGGNGNDDHPMHTLQNINYVSCHDNYSLFDQLNWLLGSGSDAEKMNDPSKEPKLEDVARASASVNGMILLSNAMSFIQGGEEIFRTKIETAPLEELKPQDLTYETKMYGKRISHNAYKSTDEVNGYDYKRKHELIEYYNHYKKLVELKKTLTFSQCYVDGSGLKAGDAASIDTANSNDTMVGLSRKTIDGSTYHCYLTNKTGWEIKKSGTILYKTGEAVSKDGHYDCKTSYSLTIIKG